MEKEGRGRGISRTGKEREGMSGAGREGERMSGAGREGEGMSGAGRDKEGCEWSRKGERGVSRAGRKWNGIQPYHFILFHQYLHLIVTVDGQRGRGWDGVVAEVKWLKWG